MIKIKKIIDIILISAAVAAVAIFADRIIPLKDLDRHSAMEEKSIDPVSDTAVPEDEEPPEYDFEIVIDETLFLPGKSIAASGPWADGGDAAEKDRVEAPKDRDRGTAAGNTVNADESEGSSGEEEKILDEIDYNNSGDFRIEVDLSRQRLIVFHKDEVLREMICSGGVPGSPTPLGEYTTSEKIEYYWVERFGVGAYYWIRFFEDYLIHSVPFDENGNMIVEEYEKLGNPASHGCIRLRLEEAKWLYETLPLGVKIIIY